jgi:RTX calcium-binding nonapeptide repeat (4 copies)
MRLDTPVAVPRARHRATASAWQERRLCGDLAPARLAARAHAAQGRPSRRQAPISPKCSTACATSVRQRGSKVRQQFEPPGVVGAVVHPAQRDEPNRSGLEAAPEPGDVRLEKEAGPPVDDRSPYCLTAKFSTLTRPRGSAKRTWKLEAIARLWRTYFAAAGAVAPTDGRRSPSRDAPRSELPTYRILQSRPGALLGCSFSGPSRSRCVSGGHLSVRDTEGVGRVSSSPSTPVPRAVVVVLAACLLVPSTAAAATADADVSRDEGLRVGPVTFTGAPGEANRLTISHDINGWLFRDRANPVKARGDCVQVNRHTARCPSTEDTPEARLGDGDDRASVESSYVAVAGASGDDVLVGSSDLDRLLGGSGDDVLHGRGGDDQLNAGPGRDRLRGDSGDDLLVDGETDAQAAPDVFVGGSDRDLPFQDPGDKLTYGMRRSALRIDLRGGKSSTEDRIVEVESVVGGQGDDRLTGDSGDNFLGGGAGADVVHGGDGADIPMGGKGADRVYGDDGDDVVWGEEGRDTLFGGSGDDLVVSREENSGARAAQADRLRCGDGEDDAGSDSDDTLTADCETVLVFYNALSVRSRPAVNGDSAEFTMSCSSAMAPRGCNGTISLRALDGPLLGTAHFAIPAAAMPGAEDDAVVSVPLNPKAVAALRAGTTLQVDVVSDAPALLDPPGGYRVFIRTG